MRNNHNANVMVKNQRCVRIGREVWFWVGGFEEEESDLEYVALRLRLSLELVRNCRLEKRSTFPKELQYIVRTDKRVGKRKQQQRQPGKR